MRECTLFQVGGAEGTVVRGTRPALRSLERVSGQDRPGKFPEGVSVALAVGCLFRPPRVISASHTTPPADVSLACSASNLTKEVNTEMQDIC